jgi:hypothetical protein
MHGPLQKEGTGVWNWLRGLAATFTEHEQNGGVLPTIRGIAAFPGVLAPQAAHDSYLEATATSRLDEIAERHAAPVEKTTFQPCL